MSHPIFVAALKRPDLLFQHVSNYVELLKDEAADIGKCLAVRAAAAAVALVAVLLALGLTATAVMLGTLNGVFHWVLVVVPGVAWLFALVGVAIAMRSNVRREIQDVREEVENDLDALRIAKEMKS